MEGWQVWMETNNCQVDPKLEFGHMYLTDWRYSSSMMSFPYGPDTQISLSSKAYAALLLLVLIVLCYPRPVIDEMTTTNF
jgi:hypothetical protein